MATVYTIVKSFCRQNNQPPPTLDEKRELGSRILDVWFSQNEIKKPIYKTSVREPEGMFTAITYPKEFTPTILKIIKAFYKDLSPPPKKERKKIPINRTPENKRFKQHYLKPNK